MEQIINISGINYRVTSDNELDTLQMTDVVKRIEKMTCNTCNGNTSIKTLAACTRTGKANDVITLTASASGGTPPYSIQFKKAGTNLSGCTDPSNQCSCTDVLANVTKTCKSTISASDTFPITFSVLVTDTVLQTCTKDCVMSETPAAPTCSFTVT